MLLVFQLSTAKIVFYLEHAAYLVFLVYFNISAPRVVRAAAGPGITLWHPSLSSFSVYVYVAAHVSRHSLSKFFPRRHASSSV